MELEWEETKNRINIYKHKISFFEAQEAFFDKNRIIAIDIKHSSKEKRYFCFGLISNKILTVRFTIRNNKIRIIGAGYWREGRRKYEEAQKNTIS